MTEEQKKILKMVEDGKINASEAMQLMKALEQAAAEDRIEVFNAESASGSDSSREFFNEKVHAPEFDQVRQKARRFAAIPLWLGVLTAILTAWGMYSVQQNAGMNFWFFCLFFPFMFGVLLIGLGSATKASRWLYLNVEQPEGKSPRNIRLGFPLPIVKLAWLLRNIRYNIPGVEKEKMAEILNTIEGAAQSSSELLIVNVDEGEKGERVQIFIG